MSDICIQLDQSYVRTRTYVPYMRVAKTRVRAETLKSDTLFTADKRGTNLLGVSQNAESDKVLSIQLAHFILFLSLVSLS